MKPILIPVKKPRNPLVTHALKRKAGKHADKKRKDKNTHKE